MNSNNRDRKLPGSYTSRPATIADAGAATEMFNACSLALVGVKEHDEDKTQVEWTTPGFCIETDTLLVISPSGEIVGCEEVWDEKPHVRVGSWGRVHPAFQGKGIGRFLLTWAEDRSRLAVDKAPAEARVALVHSVDDENKPAQSLLADLGFALSRHFWRMIIDMDEEPAAASWPSGTSVRTFAPGRDDRSLGKAMMDAFQDHYGYVETPFEEELARWRHRMGRDKDFDPSLWFLAVEGDEIVGASLCYSKTSEDPNMGYVHTLGVGRNWRRRGIALALLHHSFGALYGRGKASVSLHVDSESLTGATELYTKAGMHVDRLSHAYEKELRPGIELARR